MTKLIENIAAKQWPAFLVIALSALTLYSFALTAPFKYLDDTYSIVSNPTIHDITNAGRIFTESFFGAGHYYRPLVSLSFMFDYHFFGLDSFYYNLESFLIHIASAWIIFLSMSLLLNDRTKGFWVGFLFAVHPIHWEALCNISGRAILLSGFFIFSSFYFYLLFLKYRQSVVHLILSVLFFAGGLLCKESAAMLPVVLIGHLFWIKRAKLKEYVWLLPYFIIIAIYIFVRKILGFTSTYPWDDTAQLSLGFVSFLSSVLIHLWSFVYPFDLHFDRSFAVYKTAIDPGVIMTLIIYAGIFTLIVQCYKRIEPVVLFALFWFFVELFPVAQVVTTIGVQPGVISTADHFLYVPSVAVFILLVFFAQGACGMLTRTRLASKVVCMFCIGGILISWMMMTQKQAVIGRSALSMLTQSIAENPNNARVRTSLGLEYARIRQFALAEEQFRKSLELRPAEPIATISFAQSLCDQGRFGECILTYEEITDVGGLESLYEDNLNLAYQARVRQYENFLKSDPENADLYYNLAVAQSKSGMVKKAVASYLKAIDLKPDFRMALFNLGAIYEGEDQYMKAAQYYELMLGIVDVDDENSDYARVRLIDLYTKLNMPERIKAHRNLPGQ